MFVNLFFELRRARVPVTLREYLTLLEGVKSGVAGYRIEDFYYLSRATLVKDERNIDKFDQVFAAVFKGMETLGEVLDKIEGADIPAEWLRRLAEKHLTPEEMEKIKSLGGWDKLMETLRERLRKQQGRHQGGNKWIGTAGTSPFGAFGYNPEGVRIGQEESRHKKAVKVWDRRDFKNLDDSIELGTRNIKMALRRLRRFAREGAASELDLPDTIHSTAHQGWLDIKMVPERHNRVKVLLFLDVGGSMDEHVRVCEELFSAARAEFKHLEYFYFHNCVYEGVWRDNHRRHDEKIPLTEVLRTYPSDYKVIFVGDASMSPYEIVYPGGSVEHWNEEAGNVWLGRILDTWPSAVWINPVPEKWWGYTESIRMISSILNGQMFGLTLDGLDRAMKELNH